jgi:hypothetical protein
VVFFGAAPPPATTSALHAGQGLASAATDGYQRALLVGTFVLLGAGVIALFSSNERQTAPSESMEVATDAA